MAILIFSTIEAFANDALGDCQPSFTKECILSSALTHIGNNSNLEETIGIDILLALDAEKSTLKSGDHLGNLRGLIESTADNRKRLH